MRRWSRRVAIATAAGVAPRSDDDVELAGALGMLGVESAIVDWDDAEVDWTGYSGVVVRTCWDYHLDPARFLGWLAMLERAGVPVWNDPATIRWNHSKSYLGDLAAAGVTTVPTRWVARGASDRLAAVLDAAGWDDVVVKPAVSASAYGTWRASRSGDDREADFRRLVDAGPVLVQPFMEAVQTGGEWSLCFIDGRYSHAVLKSPRPGDFRVQESWGGRSERMDPPAGLIAEARAVLAAAPAGTLYARVDGCVEAGRFHLMELELIEPYLFLARVPGSAALLASALVRRMGPA